MTENRDTDPAIVRLFEDERRADEVTAPDLDALLVRPAGRRVGEVRPGRRVAFAAAALALVALVAASAVVVVRTVRSRVRAATEASVLPPEAIALSTWKSPTDAFLETPGSDLWTQVPDFAPAPQPVPGHIPISPTKGVD